MNGQKDRNNHQVINEYGQQISVKKLLPFAAFTSSVTVEVEKSLKIDFKSKENKTYNHEIQMLRI